MTPSLTDAQIQEIEQRANAATPGPWTWELTYELDDGIHWAITNPQSTAKGAIANALLVLWETSRKWFGKPVEKNPDLVFIAHVREDVPALIAALREARAEARIWKRRAQEAREIETAGRMYPDIVTAADVNGYYPLDGSSRPWDDFSCVTGRREVRYGLA